MFDNKKYLKDISRKRIPENRDLLEGLRLDRNERVSKWESDIINKIFLTRLIEWNFIYYIINHMFIVFLPYSYM